MITHSDDGPEFEPDDPLAVVLRPASGHLAPPPGRYEEIRRGAARRRLVRAVVGAGVTCVAAALVVLPLQSSTSGDPVSPSVPLAPPPVSSPSATPPPSVSPEPAEAHPTPRAPTDGPGTPVTGVAPVPGPR